MTNASGSCCLKPSGYLIVVLMLATAVATTGWIVTATQRERVPTAQAVPPETKAETVFVPVIVPVMSEPVPVEMVEILVASKDLPVGTVFTRDELKTAVKSKKVPKDVVPPAAVLNAEDLVGTNLARPIRAEETFTNRDLRRGTWCPPDGYDMYSLALSTSSAAGGFVGPGSRVNVLATLRVGNRMEAFPLLVNLLVVAVDARTFGDKSDAFQGTHTVSFAVTEKQALTLSLAKSRGCTLELLLRHPNKNLEADKKYNIDEVIKLLLDEPVGCALPHRQKLEEPAPPKPDLGPEVAPAPRAVR